MTLSHIVSEQIKEAAQRLPKWLGDVPADSRYRLLRAAARAATQASLECVDDFRDSSASTVFGIAEAESLKKAKELCKARLEEIQLDNFPNAIDAAGLVRMAAADDFSVWLADAALTELSDAVAKN